jgi:hypothetical protein
MENDFSYMPQWQEAAYDILEEQGNTPYFNGYPNLPDPN